MNESGSTHSALRLLLAFGLLMASPHGLLGQVQLGQDIEGEASIDESGKAIAMSDDGLRLAIGAEFNAGNGLDSGHVRVYELQQGVWVQLGEDIDGEAERDFAGRSVALSSNGEVVAIGAPGNADNGAFSGHVRVFEFDGSGWIQVAADIDGEFPGDLSGSAVDLADDGSRVVIGSPLSGANGPSSGQVRIFELQQGAWVQLGDDIDGEAAGDFSG